MAKPKKGSSSTKKTYVSKGQRNNSSKTVSKAVRRARNFEQNRLNEVLVWKNGGNPNLSVPNSDPKNTKERFIKVEAKEYWGKHYLKYLMNNKDSITQ